MTEENEREFTQRQLADDIKTIKQRVEQVVRLLYGDMSDADLVGLVYMVKKNSEFRTSATRLLWIITTTVIGIIVGLLFDLI